MATTKKTKKIVTPIDERETFVSLQKNFADTESNTEEKLKTLYDLQNADNAIEKLIQLRGELPSEVAELEKEVSACNGKIAELEQVIAQYNDNIASMNEDIVSLDGEMSKYQSQLENISNSREFDSINKELENLGILRKIDEKKIGESRGQAGRACKDRRIYRQGRESARKEARGARRQAGRAYAQRIRPHPRQRPQPPCSGDRFQRRLLRGMLQQRDSPASYRHCIRQEARHL